MWRKFRIQIAFTVLLSFLMAQPGGTKANASEESTAPSPTESHQDSPASPSVFDAVDLNKNKKFYQEENESPRAPETRSDLGVLIFMGLICLGLIGSGFILFRKFKSPVESKILFDKIKPRKNEEINESGKRESFLSEFSIGWFKAIQEAKSNGDFEYLEAHLSPPLYEKVSSFAKESKSLGRMSIIHMTAELLDSRQEAFQRLISIRYTGMIREWSESAPETLDEVWHFIEEDGKWLLSGIDKF